MGDTRRARETRRPKRASKPKPQPKPPSRLPRPLLEELRLSARGKASDEAAQWVERALDARAAGDDEEVRRTAVRAKQAAPRSPTVRELLGMAAFRLGLLHEAAQELLAYRRFSGNRHHDPVIAECYRRDGRPERALGMLDDLRRDSVPAAVWRAAQVARARALADSGKRDVAVGILQAEQGAGNDPIIEAVLKDLQQAE